MATTSDPVYRCTCSWVGGDPDLYKIDRLTCPRCLCTRTRACSAGAEGCWHCDRCDHAWIPPEEGFSQRVATCPACWHHDKKRVAVFAGAVLVPPAPTPKPRPLPDLFKEDSKSKVMRVLRWVLQEGEVTSKAFKQAHVDLGGTEHSTHAFDRYFEDKARGRYNDYVPRSGNHGILRRMITGAKGGPNTVKWIGSEGETFFERARGWFDRMTLTSEKHTELLSELEARVLAEQSEESREIAMTWYRAAQTATPTVRSPVRKASRKPSRKRNARRAATEVPAKAA